MSDNRCWYEVQRLSVDPDEADDVEWVMWEQFHYMPETIDTGKPRKAARAAAYRAAKDCQEKTGSRVRVLFIQLSKEFPDAA